MVRCVMRCSSEARYGIKWQVISRWVNHDGALWYCSDAAICYVTFEVVIATTSVGKAKRGM
eukprot:7782795-Pyramimonas_sp.AAC.1